MKFLRRKTPGNQWEENLNEELRFHLEKQMALYISAGMSPQEARRRALLEFGGVESVKEECREHRKTFLLETLWADLRYGLRMFRMNPGFTAIAVLTLALGIGANTAIFSVLDAVVLKPLPYPQADRLALIWTEMKSAGQSRAPSSGPDLLDIRHRARLLQDAGGIWVGSAAVTGTGDPEQIKLGFTTPNFLALLGIPPAKGRLFNAQDDLENAGPVIIITDGLWRRKFGGDENIIGRSMIVNGRASTIVGVMPASFRLIFPDDASVPPDVQAWVTFGYDLSGAPRDLNYLRVIGRLSPGATLPQAREELHSIAAQLRAEYPVDSKAGIDFEAFSLQQDTTRDTQPAILALFVGVGLVLLIACANVANLLLSRAGLRHREIALRATLGASRSRIVRQLLTESILLALLGGLSGLLLGWWGMKWLLALRPKSMVLLDAVRFNFPVLGYAFAISLLAGIIFGLAPSLEASKANLNETLKATAQGIVSAKQRYRTLLVTSEVALGFLLLVGAGLMTRTFARLINVDTGFQVDHVLTFQISPPESRYPKDQDRVRLIYQLKKNLEALPGVQSVGGVHLLPFDDYANWYSYYWLPGAAPQDQNTLLADHRSITPGFFRTLGIPLIAGRDFDESDAAARRRVVIVDESLAKQVWPDQSAIGKELNVETIQEGDFSRATAVVIGVVKHTKYLQLTGEGRPQIYEPYAQSTREIMAFAIRTKGEPQVLIGAIRAEVAKLDTNLPLSKVRPMDEYVRMARASARFTMLLALALAGLALALASIGIYGVTSCSVVQRKNEIGIRMALGAQARDILQIVLSEGMAAVFAGITIGLLLSLLATPMLSSLLFGVRPTDILTFVTSALFLSAVGLLACCIPARRAMRVDPIVALRYE
jgi:putative ABC transport system permease protein